MIEWQFLVEYLIQQIKIGFKKAAPVDMAWKEHLPGQWSRCGSKAVSYSHSNRAHIFEAKLTVGHAWQHSTS